MKYNDIFKSINYYLTHMFFAILDVARQYGKQMFRLSLGSSDHQKDSKRSPSHRTGYNQNAETE